MDDLRTPHLDLPLPCNPDSLEADMPRILAAFRALDAKIEALDTLLASDDVTLDTVQELVAAIKAARTDLNVIDTLVADQLAAQNSAIASQLAAQNAAVGQQMSAALTDVFAYDNRGDLRTAPAADGAMAMVEGLGLFVFRENSTEPDDDESCFATATGRWLLEAVHWDVVDAWQLPDDEARDATVLFGTAFCPITNINNMKSASFAGTVMGAEVGDSVIVTPPGHLASSVAASGLLSYYAWVSAPDSVTVMLGNPSSGNITTNPNICTDWPVVVIKH